MTRPLEEQIRALAQRNVDGVPGEPSTEATRGFDAYPIANREHGGRRVLLAAACVVLLAAVGLYALMIDRRGGDAPVATGPAAHLIPPTEAVAITGWLVPEGSSIDFTVDTGDYQLTQIDVPSDGSPSSGEIIDMMKGKGAQELELEGIGTVYLICPSVPSTDADGTTTDQRTGATALAWFANGQVVNLLPRSAVPASVPCDEPDAGDEVDLLKVARSLRTADQGAWESFVAANKFTTSVDEESTTTSTGSPIENPTAFCDLVIENADTPEAYVGSAQHVADLRHLAEVAPSAVRTEVEAVLAYVSSGAVDPTKPDTQLITNWPTALQSATAKLSDYSAATCGVRPPG